MGPSGVPWIFFPADAGTNCGEAGPDFEVDLLDGGSFKLSDMRGKVVLIFFFGNTCPACQGAAPYVESEIYQEFMSNSNFAALGLDTWNSTSNVQSVGAFKGFTGLNFPLAIMAGQVASDYGSTYDRLLVIDQDGILVHKTQLGAKKDIPYAVAAIQEALIVAGIGDKVQEGLSLRLYPVPAKDRLYVEAEEEIRSVRFYNVGGSQLFEQHFVSGSTQEISLEGLAGGLNFYRVDMSSGSSTGKIIVR